jgi:hypothetical protein
VMLGHFDGDLGRNSFLAGVDRANRLDQLLPHHVLQQIT